MTLEDAIAKAHATNEQKVAAAVPRFSEQLNPEHLAAWNRFCSLNGLRNCPANPRVVAAWIRSEKDTAPAKIIETLAAIELLHDVHGLANPIATSVVRAELERVLQIEAPRSWPRHDQLRFAALPVETRGIIAKRERDRDRWLRNKQNQLAEELKRLRDGAAKPVTQKEKESTNEKIS